MASNTWKVEIIIEDQITEDNTYNAKSLADEIEHHILAHTTGLKILELKAGLIASKVDSQLDYGTGPDGIGTPDIP